MVLKTTPANPAGLLSPPGGLSPPAPPDDPLPEDHTQTILETTKHVAALLKRTGRPFALAGSVAAFAHGLPARFQHDTDFCVRPEDADTAIEALEGGAEGRLVALCEHYCDFGDLLPMARMLREQIDWDRLDRDHRATPLPDAFLYLLARLQVIDRRPAGPDESEEAT